DMGNNFGPIISYHIQDDAAVDNRIGYIKFGRSGADNSGRFSVITNNAGTESEKFAITPSGTLVITTTPTIDNTNTNLLSIDGSGNVEIVEKSSINSSISGLTENRIPYATSSTTLGDDSALNWDPTNGRIGIGTASPDRTLHAELESATTNAVTYLARLTSTSSGTPANGIGVGIEFEVETAAGNNEIVSSIDAVTTNVTSNNESADLVFNTMGQGSIGEVLRLRKLAGP